MRTSAVRLKVNEIARVRCRESVGLPLLYTGLWGGRGGRNRATDLDAEPPKSSRRTNREERERGKETRELRKGGGKGPR